MSVQYSSIRPGFETSFGPGTSEASRVSPEGGSNFRNFHTCSELWE